MGAWSGSHAGRVESLSGVDDLDTIFEKKKIRWAASVYGRYLPSLKHIAAKILQERYADHNVHFNWMEEQIPRSDCKVFAIEEYDQDRVEEHSDGSKLEDAAAAAIATARQALYLGLHATVMDAEMAGVLLALRDGYLRIALDTCGSRWIVRERYRG